MLKKLHWKDEYTTGLEVIDSQHKSIMETLSKIYDALTNVEINQTLVDEFVRDFDFYITVHFETEEKIMQDVDYPRYEGHRRSHQFFVNKYKDQSRFYGKTPHIHIFTLHLADTLGEWLDEHLSTSDRELAEFLRLKNNQK